MIFDPRSSSRRWMRVTLAAKFVRKVASSRAVSPPPTTAISWSRKKKPSQVAQALRPLPKNFSSPGRPSQRAVLPEAMITAGTVYSPALVVTLKGCDAQVDGGDGLGLDHRAETLGLGLELLHQLGPLDPVGEAGVVLDLGGDGQLAARLLALEQEVGDVGAAEVQAGGVAGGAGADDDDLEVLVLAHFRACSLVAVRADGRRVSKSVLHTLRNSRRMSTWQRAADGPADKNKRIP